MNLVPLNDFSSDVHALQRTTSHASTSSFLGGDRHVLVALFPGISLRQQLPAVTSPRLDAGEVIHQTERQPRTTSTTLFYSQHCTRRSTDRPAPRRPAAAYTVTF